MLDSNYFTLCHVPMPRSERAKREQFLADTIEQLKAYKIKAHPAKIATIEKLIRIYEEIIQEK